MSETTVANTDKAVALIHEERASVETAGSILAARAEAMVKARAFLAKRFPRNWEQVRRSLLDACARPGFAGSATEKVYGAGWYRLPKGEGIEGFSIRFAEECARALGNLDIETITIHEDDEKRILQVNVTDLESNNSWPTSVPISRTVERKFPRKEDEIVRWRINSKGERVALVKATEDEVFVKQQAFVARAQRNGILKLVPGDILAECRALIIGIRNKQIAAEDPKKMEKEIVDGFSKLKVRPTDLADYLGHPVGQCTLPELADLRDLWHAVKDGKVDWHAAVREAKEERGEVQTQVVDPLLNTVKGAAAPATLTPKEAKAELEVLVEKARQQPKGRRSAPEPVVAKASAAPGCTSCGADLSSGRTYEDAEGRPYCEGCGSKL